MNDLNEFIYGYTTCMLWSSSDDDGDWLDENFTVADIAEESMSKIRHDCKRFYDLVKGRLVPENYVGKELSCSLAERAGHDFWLTRNRHGCGFWDGDWQKIHGEAMTSIAHEMGEVNVYVGEDGFLHYEGGKGRFLLDR